MHVAIERETLKEIEFVLRQIKEQKLESVFIGKYCPEERKAKVAELHQKVKNLSEICI